MPSPSTIYPPSCWKHPAASAARAWTRELNGIPIDLGCGYLHSGDRNPWTEIADASGFKVQRREPAWHQQFENLGFSQAESAAAEAAFSAWEDRLPTIAPENRPRYPTPWTRPPEWNPYLQALSGYISGTELEHISIADYLAYDNASTYVNWRVAEGYGTLIAASRPSPQRPCTSARRSWQSISTEPR